jgi:hypothetical protein
VVKTPTPNDPLNTVLPDPEELRVILPKPSDILGALDPSLVQLVPAGGNRIPCLRETGEVYQEFLFRFIKPVMFTESFYAGYQTSRLSEFLDFTLEAYAVLTYVGNYDSWMDKSELQAKGKKEKESKVERRFTESARGNGKYKGWSDEAMKLYNTLATRIKEQRLDPNLKNFERELMAKFNLGVSPVNGMEQPDEEAPVFMNNLGGVVDDDQDPPALAGTGSTHDGDEEEEEEEEEEDGENQTPEMQTAGRGCTTTSPEDPQQVVGRTAAGHHSSSGAGARRRSNKTGSREPLANKRRRVLN